MWTENCRVAAEGLRTGGDNMGDTNRDMDQLRNAEFKEAFDEFDTVRTLGSFNLPFHVLVGRERHHLP